MKAISSDVFMAESDSAVDVERNHYFPISAIKPENFTETQDTSFCGCKGLASRFEFHY